MSGLNHLGWDADLNFSSTVEIFEICPGSDFIIIENWAKTEKFPKMSKFVDC